MNRRELLQLTSAAALTSLAPVLAEAAAPSAHAAVPQFDIFELPLEGPPSGNPFVDVTLTATFSLGHRSIVVDGFYDGGTTYRVRFMPDTPGAWAYATSSNTAALDARMGTFQCSAARTGEHGPVGVAHTRHFAHADGTAFFPFGTTAYAWNHQGDTLEQETLETLAKAPFNKIRMCVFPKSYQYNRNEPVLYPFPRAAGVPLTAPGDTTRFNPAYFQHLEQRIGQLRALGIQVDLIVFHPYDRWGYSNLGAATDDRYVRYLVARVAAYSNIWWSLANEYDFVRSKTTADFARLLNLVQRQDPYQHLRSIHYSRVMWDYASPSVTHASLQTYDLSHVADWSATWNTPIEFDEMQYEGDIPSRFGNLSGQEMARRFWLTITNGCYATHGECFLSHPATPDPEEIVWWSKGGKLVGTSPARIAFLRKLVESSNTAGFDAAVNPTYPTAIGADAKESRVPAATVLCYFDQHQAVQFTYTLPEGGVYSAELIDPWEMTTSPLPGTYSGKAAVNLPVLVKPNLAVRFTRVAVSPKPA